MEYRQGIDMEEYKLYRKQLQKIVELLLNLEELNIPYEFMKLSLVEKYKQLLQVYLEQYEPEYIRMEIIKGTNIVLPKMYYQMPFSIEEIEV